MSEGEDLRDTNQRFDMSVFREAFHEYGEIQCKGCGETVDLSTAEDVDEALELWNDHVREMDE